MAVLAAFVFSIGVPIGPVAIASQPIAAGPSVVGVNGRLAVIRWSDVWTVNPDGSDPVQLTFHGDAYSVSWSPDGTRIAYAHETAHTGLAGLWIIDAGTGVETQVTSTVLDQAPTWSPDGGQIAFIRLGGPGGVYGEQVFIVNADGTDPHRLVEDGSMPSWSPYGDWIAFSRWRRGSPPDYQQSNDLYVVKPDGSDLRNLTVDADGTPPSGTLQILGADPTVTASVSLLADATDYPVEDQVQYGPVWSSDGSQLAFVCSTSHPYNDNEPRELCSMTLADGAITQLTYSDAETGFPERFSLSPDGTQIAYCTSLFKIYIANADGTGPVLLPSIASDAVDWQAIDGQPPPSPAPEMPPGRLEEGMAAVMLSNDGITWRTLPYASDILWSLSDPEAGGTDEDGLKTVYAKWVDITGNTSSPVSATVMLDRVAPTTSAPSAALPSGPELDGNELPVRLTWSGTDANGSGIVRYALSRSTDGGSSWRTISSLLTGPPYDVTLPPSGTRRYRVRALDAAGHWSAWAVGPILRPRLTQDGNDAITYRGTWAKKSSTSFSGGSAHYTTTAKSSAAFSFSARSVALVSTMGPTRGKVRIYVDGTYHGTVDLYSASLEYRVLVWSQTWASKRTRDIRLVAVGTTGRPRVDIDAVASIR